MYEDGTPGELFMVMAKEGSVVSGLMDSFATAISLALQYGVPLQVLADKFSHTRFEPSRLHRQPGHPHRQVDHRLHLPVAGAEVHKPTLEEDDEAAPAATEVKALADSLRRPCDAEPVEAAPRQRVPEPGGRAAVPHLRRDHVRSGACYKCNNCGATSGCS